MTGEIFWKRVTNASRFLDDAIDELLSGHSVVLKFEDSIPWKDIMLDILFEKLLLCLSTGSPDLYSDDGITDPGDFLLNQYFDNRDIRNYWPASGSIEKYMAKKQDSSLHRRIILIKDIPETRSHTWISTVTEYLRYADPKEHALFLLITTGTTFHGSNDIAVQSYHDYISEYDCLMLCMNMLSGVKSSVLVKKYISELAVQLAGNRLEYAGQFAEYGIELISHTTSTVQRIYPELSSEKVEEVTEQSLWEVQIRIVYPELEHFRRRFVRKYEEQLKVYLPITDSAGEKITETGSLEIGQLHHLCTAHHIADKTDFDKLCHMRRARNNLSHGNTVSYTELQQLGIIG